MPLIHENSAILKLKSIEVTELDIPFLNEYLIFEMRRACQKNNILNIAAIQLGVPLKVMLVRTEIIVNPIITKIFTTYVEYSCLNNKNVNTDDPLFRTSYNRFNA